MIAGGKRWCANALLAVAAGVSVHSAQGGGFYVPQKGATGVGLASAGGAARASDASTVFFNPAGMTLLETRRLEAGIDFLSPDVKISNRGSTATTPGTGGAPAAYTGTDGHAGELTPVPNIYFATPLSPEFWFGFAATSPFGLSVEYARDWFGRYDSIESKLLTVNLTPAVAWRVSPVLSFGGGLDIQYADAKLTNAVPDPLQGGGPTAASDGLATLTGDGWATGFNLGLLYHPSAATRVGLHYRSGMSHRLEGDASIEGLTGPLAGANGRFKSKTEFSLPPILSLALAQQIAPAWRLLAEMQWFQWSDFDEVRIHAEGLPDSVRTNKFRDSRSFAVGAEFQATQRWTWRAGVRVENTPTVDAFRNTSIPDSDLRWLGIGASYRSSERMMIDLGFTQARFKQADINLNSTFFDGTPAASTVNIRGRTDNVVDTLSMSVRYRF